MLFRFELKLVLYRDDWFRCSVHCLNAVITIASYNDYSLNYEADIVNIFEGLKTNEIAKIYKKVRYYRRKR